MEDKVNELKNLLIETIKFFFPKDGFAKESLFDVILNNNSPSVRALDFIEHSIKNEDNDLELKLDVIQDSFYATHREKIIKIDKLVYAKFMNKKTTEIAVSKNCNFMNTQMNVLEHSNKGPNLFTDLCLNFSKEADLSTDEWEIIEPVIVKKPKLTKDIPDFISEYITKTSSNSEVKESKENNLCTLKATLQELCGTEGLEKGDLKAFYAELNSQYLSDGDLVHLCDYAFEVLHSKTEIMLQIYFLLLDKMHKIQQPTTFSSVLNLVESYLFNNMNFHYIFKVFRKIHPKRVLNLLELVLKNVYEVDIEIKMIAFDILLKEKDSVDFLNELISYYSTLDSRKIDGIELRHFMIMKCFSSSIVSKREKCSLEGKCSVESVVTSNKNPIVFFVEEKYLKCVIMMFSDLEDTFLKEIVLSSLKKLRTCGLSRTFVISLIVFSINKLRSIKKLPQAFLLFVFGRFLAFSYEFGERVFETIEEEIVYNGILKISNTRESLVYVSRAIFMFLLKIIRKNKVFRTNKLSGTNKDNISSKLVSKKNSKSTKRKISSPIGRIIKTLTKIDTNHINLSNKERAAVIEILTSHFAFQTPYVKEIIIFFLDKMKYYDTFSLLIQLSKDKELGVKKKVFERMLKFSHDREKAPEIIKLYFFLLKNSIYYKVSFETDIISRIFYFEDDKNISKYFELKDTGIDTFERAVLVKHYSKYKPEEIDLEYIVEKLSNFEAVKIKKNSHYFNTILKIILNVISKAKKNIASGNFIFHKILKKKLEAFCNIFIFYDVYVDSCAKILKILGYSGFNGVGDYYTLLNAHLGNKIEIKANSIYEKKALLAYLDNYPEESSSVKKHLVDMFKDKEILFDLAKFLLKHMQEPCSSDDSHLKNHDLGLSNTSTVSEFYFNFISNNQIFLFNIAESSRNTKLLIPIYRLIMQSTIYGAILPQISVPKMLKIIYRCNFISVGKVVLMYIKEIINTLSEIIKFITQGSSSYNIDEFCNQIVLCEDETKQQSFLQKDNTEHAKENREPRNLLKEIFESIIAEKERVNYLKKLISLINPENSLVIFKIISNLDLSFEEIRISTSAIKDIIQSLFVSDSLEDSNLQKIIIVFILNQYKIMIKTKKFVDISDLETLTNNDHYSDDQRDFIIRLGKNIGMFK